ncbi:alpha-xylosidase [Clostridioides difficile]
MKFSNGMWLNKENYTVLHPVELYDMCIEEVKLTAYCPFVKVNTRGNTLDGGMLTTEISSPMENIIKVRITHHAGEKEQSYFKLNEKTPDIKIKENNDNYEFISGRLKAQIGKGENWGIKFYNNDKLLTETSRTGTAYITTDKKEIYMREQLAIGVGELVYGLGERFTPFVKNGQSVDIWNQDGGTASEQSYKNIPFYLTNKGYGVFVNHSENVSFEVGSESVSKVQFSVEGESLEYYIIGGNDLKEVINNYTNLTGKPTLPPAWSFGLWLTTSFCTNYDEETVMGFIDGMLERDIPLETFHFDCFWMKEFEWCNFEWDNRVFPDPEGMLKRINDKGIKVCVWINPYIGQKSPLYKEGAEKGYFVKTGNNKIWQCDRWQAGMALVDFTNPEACKWYKSHLERLIDMGVDSFKTDFGERIPVQDEFYGMDALKYGIKYYDGSDSKKMHNYYTYLYNKLVFELLVEKLGNEQACVFARSATVGGQNFPVHWGGDCLSNYPSMAESLRGGLSLSLCGFGYWSHDIGGFEEGCTADIYKRWTQFGLLSSHSRYHGNVEYKVPWIYDEEAVEVTRKFAKLKMKLMPYLFKYVVEAKNTGIPMIRPMVLEYSDDETCIYLDRQYMFGEGLLVAPIFSDTGDVSYYLPEGRWTNLLNNKVLEGRRWYKENHDYMSLPLMVKDNTIIPIGYNDKKPDYDYLKDLEINIFELDENNRIETILYNSLGKGVGKVSAIKIGNKISVQTKGISGDYKIVLRNINATSENTKCKYDLEIGTVAQTKDSEVIFTVKNNF